MKVEAGYSIQEIGFEERDGRPILKVMWGVPNPRPGVTGKWTVGIIDSLNPDSINMMLEDMHRMVKVGSEA